MDLKQKLKENKMERAYVQHIIENSGGETTAMFMDAFANQTLGKILDTLIFMYGGDVEVNNLCHSAIEIKKAVDWIETYGDPYQEI
jgi:hypothetical protein